MINIITQEEKNRIDQDCKDYHIEKYTINSDGSIDVDENVNIIKRRIELLPLRFNIVNGYFNCSNNGLTSLLGCPTKINGGFYCDYNELTSLEYCPSVIGENSSFYCNENNLTSLEHCLNKIGGDFNCDDNKLTSLVYYPREVVGNNNIHNNPMPNKFRELLSNLTEYEKKIFLKYQNYYDVWLPEFNEDNMKGLIEEIKDGLL
jgi:hypothetical protein